MSIDRTVIGRRDLLRATGGVGAAALATTIIPRSLRAMSQEVSRRDLLDTAVEPDISIGTLAELPIDHPEIKALALRAIDAAKSAGATYADVRLTRTESQFLLAALARSWKDRETLAVGIRALVNGYWGFAASPIWSADEVVTLARDAVAQAKSNAGGTSKTVDLGTIPVASGSWTMPVQIDPFAMPLEEKNDFLRSWETLARNYHPRSRMAMASVMLNRQAKAVATSEGAYFTQTVYATEGWFTMKVVHPSWRDKTNYDMNARGVTNSGKGWELLIDADPHAQIPQMFEEGDEIVQAPRKPVDLGRFETVFAAPVVALLVDQTIGTATELDRALGYEANASGTSYLTKPLSMLGAYKVGSPLVTVTGNRTVPGGVATVKWDDEGVEPNEMTLIRDGVANDFQTTREQAAWLAPWYQQKNVPLRSHGCAGAESAIDVTVQRSPNLTLAPSATNATFNDLVANVKKGFAVCSSEIYTDHQARNGSTGGETLIREIVNGKLGAVVTGGGVLFNTSELWSNVTAIGGTSSAEWLGVRRTKGQPAQETAHSVSAVPIVVKDIAMIDIMRKA